MLLIILRAAYALVCAGAIASYVTPSNNPALSTQPEFVREHPLVSFVLLLALTQLVTVLDLLFRRKRIEVISAIYFGLLIGTLLSYLLLLALAPALRGLPSRGLVEMLVTLMLPYISISLLLQTKDDFRFIIPYVEFARELKGAKPLILDSSALIDGRIADVVETRIIDSRLVVPRFVLHEVQDIADSGEKSRRARGRRGLDVLAKLQNSDVADIVVHEAEDRSDRPVDHRLVDLAKLLGGRILTNDINLHKVAALQGVNCVSLNEVASALKPRYLPGDHVHVRIQKEGETPGQGVGYLDDGTMVICEQAANRRGKEIEVIITSVLQASGGRMLFGREASGGDSPEPASEPQRTPATSTR